MAESNADNWWRNAVVYEVYPRSFNDSNGDGEGDFRGIIDRLDYLHDLGVDALWLTPFYPSPLADGGYDVADYCGVDPRFGTLRQFADLVARARPGNTHYHRYRAQPYFGQASLVYQGTAFGAGIEGTEPLYLPCRAGRTRRTTADELAEQFRRIGVGALRGRMVLLAFVCQGTA